MKAKFKNKAEALEARRRAELAGFFLLDKARFGASVKALFADLVGSKGGTQ